MVIPKHIISRAKRKALDSICKFRVSAIGLNKKGEVVIACNNSPRFSRFGGGKHAEMQIMRKCPSVKTIIICRVNAQGKAMPIDPCSMCFSKSQELGIKIRTIAHE